MTITSLSQAVRDRERVNIFVDGRFGFAIDKSTLANYMLYQGVELSSTQISEILQVDNTNYLYRKILEYWFARPRSSREISTKINQLLAKREAKLTHKSEILAQYQPDPAKLIADVLTKLKENGYNNTHFANWYAEQRASQGKYGKQRVVAELTSKGVPRAEAQAAVDKHFAQDDQLAEALLTKKFGVASLKQITDPKLKARAYRWLVSRGVKPV